MPVDVELAKILKRFMGTMLGSHEVSESLTVRVQRTLRFSHRLRTAKGLMARIDEPSDFGGTGAAPDPAEYLLGAIGVSLSVTLQAHAALAGLSIDSVELSVSGSIDARGFFEPLAWPDVRGVREIVIEMNLGSSSPPADVRALVHTAMRASPVVAALKRRPTLVLRLTEPRTRR